MTKMKHKVRLVIKNFTQKKGIDYKEHQQLDTPLYKKFACNTHLIWQNLISELN